MTRTHKRAHGLQVAVWCIAALLASGCNAAATAPRDAPAAQEEPSRLASTDDPEVSRVILTQQAATRLDIQTQAIATREVDGVQRNVVPYAAVIYDLEGKAWVYTIDAPLSYVRASIDVDTIEGDMAVLADGPPPGTAVVTVGGAELYGAEFEFQEG